MKNQNIDFKKQFPAASNYLYLNTASSGLLPKTIVEWRQQHDLHFLEHGSVFRDGHKAHLREVKKDVARFFHTGADQVALVPNFSFGLNSILEGIEKGTRILLIKGDYPSINWPTEYRDFDVCYAELDAQLEQNIAAAFDAYKPDVFMCSMVQYISGIRLDLEFLQKLKENYPTTLMIGDGTQYLGTADYNFDSGPFDIVGASTYKWMLSGYGNGFFMMKDAAASKLNLRTIGFNSADAVYGNKDKINWVGRMEPGHQDTLNYGSLGQAIQWMETIGIKAIEEKNKALSKAAHQRFKALGWLDEIAAERENHSTIFNITGTEELFNQLKKHNILASYRGKGIRVSFHFYNSLDDLEKLITIVQSLR